MSESIYNLVPREYVAPSKPPMHRSIHDPNLPVTGSTFGCKGTTRLIGAGLTLKKSGALFGPPGSMEKPDTKDFLKKSANSIEENKALTVSSFKYTDRMKDPLPSKEDYPVMGIHANKNFITANAVEAILQVPRIVDKSEPLYKNKEDYGKVPSYLTQVKEEIRREKEMIETYAKEQMGIEDKEPERLEELSEYERTVLLEALKSKWDDINRKFQKMAHIVNLDTIGQVRRKEAMDKELKQLESDIEKLQRMGPILVKP